MTVDSYLELFTTLFGWAFYGILWDVLVGTGIVFLPFLGILIDNWREPAEGGQFGTVTGLSLRRMEIELFIALLVVVLAGQPAALTPLNAGTLSYTPPPTLINPTPTTATVAAPQSTYGTTGFTGSPATVNIPVWWYAVMAMTSGLNHAVVEGLPSAADMRTYEQQARLATIADPRLRQEVSDFFSQCYIPARSKYQAERPATAAVNALLSTYGPDDPEWMGSHVYRDTPGYYDTRRPTMQISGWTYNAVRDTEYDPAARPAWGKPDCKEWWEDGTIGLREKLINEADATSSGFSGLVVAVAPALATEKQNDAVARTVLTNSPPSWSNNDLVANNSSSTGLLSTAESWVKGGLASGGVRTRLRRCGHRIGNVFGDHDCGSARTSHGAGRAPARHIRLASHGGGAVALLDLHDGDRRHGHLHRQVLERALVSGIVGGSESHHVHVSGREHLPADLRQPRRA